jgi:3-hydroxybutyryl-CoA dehydrogenase
MKEEEKPESLEDYALTRKIQKKDEIHTIGIVGCGRMGQEICRIICQSGMNVIFLDVSEEKIHEIYESIKRQLDDIENQWGLTQSDKRAILTRMRGTIDYNDLTDCDLIIESVNSRSSGNNLELRKDVFRKIEAVALPDTIIATNTSTLMITEIASVLQRPERAIGLHFMSPPSVIKIVEVVKGMETNQQTFEKIIKFTKMIDRKVIVINESPGHISTRLIVTLINEACDLLMEGVASVECIDKVMKEGYRMQLGPFELADKIGLDKVVKWMDNLYQEYGLQKFKPSPVIKRLVRANYLGRISGRGFYRYENGKIVGEAIQSAEFILH